MSLISNNIKYLRKDNHFTQEQLAEKIGIKRSLLGAYEEGRADPRLNNLLRISEIFNVSVDLLISEDLSQILNSDSKNNTGRIKSRVLAITVDAEGDENIDLIPQKASAGYLNGYADPEYLEEMPKFKIPFLSKNGTFRAFEIAGDSMLPVLPGTIIIGKYIEAVSDIKNNTTYILLTGSEGIVYKRVRTTNTNDGVLELVSDNKTYSPYNIDLSDVLEIWEAATFISQTFPESSSINRENSDFENLKSIVLELQQEVIRLKSG